MSLVQHPGVVLVKKRRWPWVVGAVAVALFALLTVGLGVIYPRVGESMIRKRVAKLATKIDREITIGKVDVSLGHVVIRDIAVRGPRDGDLPLVH
ncbi:MAG TPA: hypothetical protein VGC41_21940, partial [Kofleriaceae bacterium]